MRSVLIGYVIGENKSGIDSFLLNISGILKDAGYDVDFLTNKKTNYMSNLCQEKGMGLIEIPTLKNVPKQFAVMKHIFNKKHYDIAYFNISEAFNCIGALAAKQSKVKKIIIHSHSTSVGGASKIKKTVRHVLHAMFKTFVLKHIATNYFACSELAAKWMFDSSILNSKKYVIINNAVEVDKFEYNPIIRKQKREEISLEDKFIIGHVSGFTPTKNVTHLINIINEAKELDKSVHLLLVGEGEETELVKEKVKKLNLENYVTMLGRRADVCELLQAFDAFVLPSIFEGAPVVAIEAQVSGLMVYLSDSITREVKLSEKCKYISLEKSPKEWAKIIISHKKYNRSFTDFSKASYCFDTKKQKKELLKLF